MMIKYIQICSEKDFEFVPRRAQVVTTSVVPVQRPKRGRWSAPSLKIGFTGAKLYGLIGITLLLLTLLLSPKPAYAQEPWPPFWFDLIPSYENGKITYRLGLFSQVDWPMPDLTIKIPLPEGTRFLEASTQPGVTVEFDGQEVTFFTSSFNRYIAENSFILEVTDPTMTVFTTQSWITWKGNRPGNYLTEPMTFDIKREPLNWTAPSPSRLQLGIGAMVIDDLISYTIYPKAIDRSRMWDVKISVPLPEGAIFLSADASPPFVTGFNDQEISFSLLELEEQAEAAPLTFKLSTAGVTTPVVTTQIWAAWKNAVFDGDPVIPGEEQIMIEATVVRSPISQRVVFDTSGDVPFPSYDLKSIAFQENEAALTVIFYVSQDVGLVGQPVQYTSFIDSDCNSDTGQRRRYRGAEYQVSYNHQTGRATITPWDVATKDWRWSQVTELNSSVDGKTIKISVPYHLIGEGRQFCWVGQASNRSDRFQSNLPEDWLPNEEHAKLARYEIITPPPPTPPPPSPTTPIITGVSGKLAVSLKNERGFYDVFIFSLLNGQEIAKIPNARQPNFRADGQRLLINHESTENVKHNLADGRTAIYVLKNYRAIEDIYEYNLADRTEKQVSDTPPDSHPFYNPQGNRVVYGSLKPPVDPDDSQLPYVFVQCGLLPPHQEVEQRCQDLSNFGVLVPAGQPGEIWGNYPVWTSNDMIAYRGCDSWAQSTACGIYIVSSLATRGFSNGTMPSQLTQDANDIPSDTKGNLIAFTAYRENNWEAYLVNLDGSKVRNLSNSPNSSDGLPTISPNGNWIAFISDRNGQWAVWVVPVTGGPAQKLFDLPTNTPWGNDDRVWINERISWGP